MTEPQRAAPLSALFWFHTVFGWDVAGRTKVLPSTRQLTDREPHITAYIHNVAQRDGWDSRWYAALFQMQWWLTNAVKPVGGSRWIRVWSHIRFHCRSSNNNRVLEMFLYPANAKQHATTTPAGTPTATPPDVIGFRRRPRLLKGFSGTEDGRHIRDTQLFGDARTSSCMLSSSISTPAHFLCVGPLASSLPVNVLAACFGSWKTCAWFSECCLRLKRRPTALPARDEAYDK